MKKKFAVAFICLMDNDLKIKIVEAVDWENALICSGFAHPDNINSLPADLEAAKDEAFNQDWLFDVVEIPN